MKQPALTLFQIERQYVASDGLGQDAGDRVNHLHSDIIAYHRPQHHAKRRGRILYQPTVHQHLFIISYNLSGTRYNQQQWHQLLRLRPEIVKISPRTGTICVFQVFDAKRGRFEERGCDFEHNDNRNVGCV